MPGYEKFMKDLITKNKVVSFEDVSGLHHCSAITNGTKKAILKISQFLAPLGRLGLPVRYVPWVTALN